MRALRMLLMLVWATAPAVHAQAPDPAPAPAQTFDPELRDTSRYRYPAVAMTVLSLQLSTYAMQLREYCANRQVSDDFVRARLARFSQMSGREENCDSLADYQ